MYYRKARLYPSMKRKKRGHRLKRRQTRGSLNQVITIKPAEAAVALDHEGSSRTEPAQHDRERTSDVPMPTRFSFAKEVLDAIHHTIGRLPAEQGGMLGGNRTTGEVTHFFFDHTARRTGATYSPDHRLLTKLLRNKWNPADIDLVGFVHSHTPGVRGLSGGDLEYARVILKHNPQIEQLLLPIILTEPDTGRFQILNFSVVCDNNGSVVVERPRFENIDGQSVSAVELSVGVLTETFERVEDAYDLPRLAKCRVIAIGIGGSVGFLEDMARAGVAQFVLIDADTVSETNIATQQVYRRDIGRPKIDCIGERIIDINPNAIVVRRRQRQEDIDDAEFERLAQQPFEGHHPELQLLGGFTDSFSAQARTNALALHLGLPSLCAQVYAHGRGAEITFTYPGVTAACHRCVLNSRYKAHLEEDYRNQVTSHGTPIFATTRLNALKGFIALAILHHGTTHVRWGGLLERIGDRNLIQIRLDPDLSSSLGLSVFDSVFEHADRARILFDEAVWLPQKPDCPDNGFPTCPDCGGTGDLRTAIGSFTDTRVVRRNGG